MTRPARGTAAAMVCAMAFAAAGCTDDTGTTTIPSSTSTPTTTTTLPDDAPPALFLDSDVQSDPDPDASRQRTVELDLSVLLRANGRARQVDEITVNLFPDVTYTGIIESVSPEGNGYTWLGYLDGIEISSLTMLHTGSVFIAKFASPEGVYEVNSVGDGLYRVVLIDQGNFPGED